MRIIFSMLFLTVCFGSWANGTELQKIAVVPASCADQTAPKCSRELSGVVVAIDQYFGTDKPFSEMPIFVASTKANTRERCDAYRAYYTKARPHIAVVSAYIAAEYSMWTLSMSTYIGSPIKKAAGKWTLTPADVVEQGTAFGDALPGRLERCKGLTPTNIEFVTNSYRIAAHPVLSSIIGILRDGLEKKDPPAVGAAVAFVQAVAAAAE